MFDFFKKKDMWYLFKGKPHTEEVLKAKAEMLALLLSDWSVDNTARMLEAVKKEEEGLDIDKFKNKVSFEVLFFWMHYVDRMAFGILGPEQRGSFITALNESLINIFSHGQSSDEGRKAVETLLTDLYNERQVEYAGYKMAENENDGMAGTLFWEVGKKISSIFGSGRDIQDMMKVQIYVVGALKHMELGLLLQER